MKTQCCCMREKLTKALEAVLVGTDSNSLYGSVAYSTRNETWKNIVSQAEKLLIEAKKMMPENKPLTTDEATCL